MPRLVPHALPIGLLALLSACAQHTFVPGPGMSALDFEPDSASCRMFARGMTPEHSFSASGSPRFVAASMLGESIGSAIGDAIRANQNYNDCMEARGWRIADNAQVPPAAATVPATNRLAVVPAAAAGRPATPVPASPTVLRTVIPPAVTAQDLSPSLVTAQPEHNLTRRALGLGAAPVSAGYAAEMNAQGGLEVYRVLPGGVAYSAGVLTGDVILTLGRTPLRTVADLQLVVAHVQPNSTLVADIWRDGQRQTIQLHF